MLENIDNGRNYACVGAGDGKCLYFEFYCEHKTTLKIKVLKKITHWVLILLNIVYVDLNVVKVTFISLFEDHMNLASYEE